MDPERSLRRPAAALLAALVLTAGAQGQEPIEVEGASPFQQINSFDLAAIGYPGPQGRVVHGDPFGDLTGAMFFNVDRRVLWSPLPYSLTSVSEVAPSLIANDLVMAPSSAGDRDLCLISTATGLWAARYDGATYAFDVASVPGTSAWADAVQLKRRDVDGTQAVVGLLEDGRTVRVSAVDELGETPLFSYTAPLPVLSHDLIDYDGDGGLDVALVTTLGLYVFDPSGPLLRREAVALQKGGVVTFGSSDRERLAFWYENGNGTSYLRVVDGPVTGPELQVGVGPPGWQA